LDIVVVCTGFAVAVFDTVVIVASAVVFGVADTVALV
jgi:hypothetical protein